MAQAQALATPATSRLALGPAVKEAAVTAFVAAVLLTPLLGMQIASGSLVFHFDEVAIGVAVVFVGRLLLTLLQGTGRGAAAAPLRAAAAVGSLISGNARILGLAGLVFAFVLPFMPFSNRYIIDIGTTVLIYVMLGWGLNIVVGLAGLLDLGYVAFYAVGAYSYALIANHFGWSFWVCLPLAGVFAASFGILLGFPVLRLRGDYLAIVTLGFGEIIRIILLNWSPVTGGPNGISGIPRPSFFGYDFVRNPAEGETAFHQLIGQPYSGEHRVIFLYFLILLLALFTNFVVLRLRKLPIGRAWEALREDEIACKALGINPTNTKLTAFALGAMFGGFAGSFFATRQGFISPESFTFIESAIILAIVVLGGMGSQIGVVLAALVIVVLPELGRELEQYRMLIFGAAMVAIMVWRPGGLLSRPGSHHPAPRQARGGGRLMAEPLLEVNHLTMRFGGLVAVDDLNFTCFDREITAIIGPNGAGKTTVFNCLTGFYRPTVGELLFRGHQGEVRLEQLDGFKVARHGLARTFQNIRLFAKMSALENLLVAQHNGLMLASGFSIYGLLGLPGYRAAEAKAVELARYWLERTGLTARADWMAGNLAYGEQRKLEIARAMCSSPRILCLDEPAAGLNPRETHELADLLLQIRDETRIGILLIEHDMGMVMRISDHIVVIDYGKKIADGTPEQIRTDANVIKAYLGEPEEEDLPAEVKQDLRAEGIPV